MPEATANVWVPRSAWSGYAKLGRHGRPQGEARIRITLRDGISLATMISADGKIDAVRSLVLERYGCDLPEPGEAQMARERGLIWSAPGQWLAIAERRDAFRDLPDILRGVAAVTDQSDGRAVVRVSGREARKVLEKGVAVDLHPRAFRAGQTATTSIAHIGAQLWQLDDGPTYEVAIARSFAGSFWSWLSEAAAEFGYEVARETAS